MAFNFLPSRTSTFTAGNNTDYVLFDDRDIQVSSGNGFDFGSATGTTLTVAGTIYGERAITAAAFYSDDMNVSLEASARVIGASIGINMLGNGGQIENAGQIRATTGRGIDSTVTNNNFSIVNTGSIHGFSDGIVMNGTVGEVLNSGTVSGAQGIVVAGTGMTVYNSGEISGLGSTGTGLTQAGIGVFVTTQTDSIIENSGTIRGTFAGLQASSGDETVLNTGTIVGDVFLSDGEDSYIAAGDGLVVGTIFGGSGIDTILGGNLDDNVQGDDGNDIIRGRKGDDYLEGNAGIDRIYGGDDDDTLDGGADADRLFGDDGNDELLGGTGADILRGGDGNDRMIGGADRDVMLSGRGQDNFVFTSITDSVLGSGRDAVRDFERGEDLLDLEAIAGGSLRFIGTSAFTGTANEVRYVVTAAGSSVVRVDANGDGVRDMEILVQYLGELAESDFLI